MTLPTLNATAVISRNSIPFVRTVFELYEQRRLFAILSSREAITRVAGVTFDEILEPEEGSGWYQGGHGVIQEDGFAQISLTSGTTGTPKGIVLHHQALADVVIRLNSAMEIDDTIREYVGVPANFSFGLGRFRAIAAAGGRAYLPPRGFDPIEIGRMLADGQINALSAVPTLLRLLIAHPGAIGNAGTALRWLEIGSQPMAKAEKEAIKALFPHARIIQHYGLTEASRTTFLDISNTDGDLLGSVGSTVGATEVQVDPEGRIRIRGPHTARHRVDADGLHPLLDEDGWLVTNDLGEMRDGHLFFKGRADDLINCGGVKLVPDVIEQQLRDALKLEGGVAVARVPDAARGDGVLVAFEPSTKLDTEQVKRSATDILMRSGLTPGGALHVAMLDALPTTATGKVQRSALAKMVPIAQGEEAIADGSAETLSGALMTLLNAHRASAELSFVELGGDSLNYVRAAMLIDTHLGHLPDGWETMPLARFDQLERVQDRSAATVDCSVLVRAVAILMVVFDHAWANAAGGATLALMAVAGWNFSRFQVPRIIRGEAVALLAQTFYRVVLPYFAFVTITLAYHHRAFWPQYLLFANFTEGVRNASGERLLVPYWFMEDYLLYILIFSAGLSFRPLQALWTKRPWRSSCGMFLAAALVGLYGVFHRQMPLFYEPTLVSVAWMFTLGWAVHHADRPSRKYLVLALAIVPILVITPMDMLHHIRAHGISESAFANWGTRTKLVVAIILQIVPLWLLLFVPRVSVPSGLARILSAIAGASLYIYMAHPLVLHVVSQKGTLPMALLGVVASAITGIVFWGAFNQFDRLVANLRSGRHSAQF